MAKRWNIILPIVVVIIVGVIVFIKRDDLGSFVETIKDVSIVPFALAACCLFGRYFSHAFAYKAVFRCVDEDVKYLHIVPHFNNIIPHYFLNLSNIFATNSISSLLILREASNKTLYSGFL